MARVLAVVVTARRRTILSWSSGKDSAWSLHVLRDDPTVEVVGLLSTVNRAADRVAMHGVRRELLEAQARAAGLPLDVIELPWPCSNEQYEELMRAWTASARERAVECIAFGDLFLEDIRAYRESRLAASGLVPLFPLWGRDTAELAREMVASGLRAVLTCVDPRQTPRSFAGRTFDAELLDELAAARVDPCGERGEFHTFACAGPMFTAPIAVRTGEVVERDEFVFCDLLPA